jgi:hypothetical protein
MTSEVTSKETTPMENGDSKTNANPPQKPRRHKKFADIFVVLFCVSGAAFSLNLFRLDLYQSIASLNKKPAGTVTVKYNNVQRRFSDRMLWSRLAVESPVYLGDLIRVAEYSSATLHINDDDIDINENSLIRIRTFVDDEGRIVIDLGSGSLSVSGGKTGAVNGGVALKVMGSVIAPQAGSILSASAGENGMTVQVNEGSVLITKEDGQSNVLATGEALSLDTKGVVQAFPSAVVTLPRPNARFIKNNVEPLNVRFAWKTANIDQRQRLRLEISAVPNFKRLTQTIEGVDSANSTLGVGTWHWRLSYQGTVLSAGQFNIVDATVSLLVSPIQNSLFRCSEDLPTVLFEWQPVEEASYYILQAGLAPDLSDVLITRQTAVASFVESVPQVGTWYWQVKPVFSSIYKGNTVYSQVASFKIEQIDEQVTAVAGSVATTVNNSESAVSSSATAPESTPVEMRISPSVTMVLPELAPKQKPEAVKASGAANKSPSALLPEAKNLLPVTEKRFQFEDLRKTRRIDFSWSPVDGANAYIFILYHKGNNRKLRRVVQTEPLKKTNWTLDNLALLDRGTFVWQVEAVNINNSGKIEQRGKIKENTFIIDIPVSAVPEIEDIGVIYGN